MRITVIRATVIAAGIFAILPGCNDRAANTKQGRGDASQLLSPEQVRAQVQDAVHAYTEAINGADVSTVLALYSRGSDATTVANGDITRGWERIRAETDSTLPGLQGRFRFALGSIDVVPLGSQHALAIAPFALTAARQGGEAQLRGAITLVFQRADSGWKIIHEHSSTAPGRQR
ncbi:MAG: nuclear transport factor 2 family protein [Gemmatimonadota bacterium]|nr:nuclear transport factor 2 family protein [Gemmatimonadota bacterium]